MLSRVIAKNVGDVFLDTVYYKIDQHSSSSCTGTTGLLHIMRSNTMIFAVLKL